MSIIHFASAFEFECLQLFSRRGHKKVTVIRRISKNNFPF
jgi:hypothetical protein